MRIIGGKFKGRKIMAPLGIRPTQDKVREALFDILSDIEGLSFLELFAGSGAVGFEALSRGAADLTLVECNRDCVRAIKKNIESLLLKQCSLCTNEVEAAVRMLFKEKRVFDLIFLDPPYYQVKAPVLSAAVRSGKGENAPKALPGQNLAAQSESLAKKTLQMLEAYDILAPNGFVVVQHFKTDHLPKEGKSLVLIKEARYGDTLLSFYRKRE